jgi:hypothetical protein
MLTKVRCSVAAPFAAGALSSGRRLWKGTFASLRIFRQERHGDWAPVVARVSAALAGLVRRA